MWSSAKELARLNALVQITLIMRKISSFWWMDHSSRGSRHHPADFHMEERSLWREGRYYPVVCGRLKAARTELPSGKRWLKIELEITRSVPICLHRFDVRIQELVSEDQYFGGFLRIKRVFMAEICFFFGLFSSCVAIFAPISVKFWLQGWNWFFRPP